MKRSTLLFAAAAFSVGIGAGWGLGQLTGGAGPAAPAEPRSPPAAEPPSGKEADRSTGGADTSPPPIPSTAPSSVPAAAGAEGTATGSITGTVVGPDGRPLSGVLVRATPFGRARGDEEPPAASRPPGSPPPRPDVEEAVRRYAIRLARHEAGVREATTDESGAYKLDGLSWERYLVDAWRAGFLVESAGVGGPAFLQPGSRCDFQATPIRLVLASVLLPDGKPPERAVISWAPAGGGEGGSMEWSAAVPGIEVPPGTFEFTAWAGRPGAPLQLSDFVPGSDEGPDPDGEALYRSPSVTATVEDDGGARLEFRLEPRPGVLVNLTFEGARRPRQVRIAAVRLEGEPAGDPAPLLAGNGARERWLEENAAAASLAGLEPGTWLVGATFRGGRVGASATVAVAQGLTTVDLRVPDIDPMDSLRVRVLGPDGLPVPDAKLEYGCRGSESSDTMGVGAVPGPDGFYLVEHYAKGASSPGGGWHYWADLGDGPFTWFVQAASPRYGAVTADYDPSVDREVTLRFAAPALLRVQIPGFEANPRRDRAVLELSWEGEGDRPDLDGTLDAAGVARFPPLSPGTYELSLHLAKGSDAESRRQAGWAGTTVARVPLTLPSGETTVSVGLPAYSDLTVTFDGDAPGLQFIGPEGVPDRWEDGEEENGTVVFRDQPEGRYRLWDPRRGAMRVDLPASGPVAFVPTPFDSLLLEVTGEGYFREIGLRSGDLVVRIEGAELRDKDSMTKAMAAAMVRGTALLTIQRGASTFEVTVDVRKFMEDEGSDLEPWVR